MQCVCVRVFSALYVFAPSRFRVGENCLVCSRQQVIAWRNDTVHIVTGRATSCAGWGAQCRLLLRCTSWTVLYGFGVFFYQVYGCTCLCQSVPLLCSLLLYAQICVCHLCDISLAMLYLVYVAAPSPSPPPWAEVSICGKATTTRKTGSSFCGSSFSSECSPSQGILNFLVFFCVPNSCNFETHLPRMHRDWQIAD
jgi:hypothetical protein